VTDLRKYDAQGRQWSTYPPIRGITPWLPWDSYTPEVWDWDQDHACRVRNQVESGVELPAEPFETMTDMLARAEVSDPETPVELGPIWEQIVHRYPGVTQAQALAEFVGMDGPMLWGHELIGFAVRNELEPALEHQWAVEPGDWDFATTVFDGASLLTGFGSVVSLGACEKIVFAEKHYGECLLGGQRPGKVVEVQSGMGEHITTAYISGCPPFGDVPQGHSSFMAYMCEKAAQVWPDARHEFTHAARVGGISREYAFVHGPLATTAGNLIGVHAACGGFDAAWAEAERWRVPVGSEFSEDYIRN